MLLALFFALAISVDSFAVGFAYATNKVTIPRISVVVISVMGALFLGLALLFGLAISPYIPTYITTAICVGILLYLGIMKLFAKSPQARKCLSIRETFALGVILSIDALACGIGFGMTSQSVSFIAWSIFFTLICGATLFFLGGFVGRKIAKKSRVNLSWFGGVILILLAFSKLAF